MPAGEGGTMRREEGRGRDAISGRRTQEGRPLLLDWVGEDGGEGVAGRAAGASTEASPSSHVGLQRAQLVAFAHFPNQTEFELLLFLGSWKHPELLEKRGCRSLCEVPGPSFLSRSHAALAWRAAELTFSEVQFRDLQAGALIQDRERQACQEPLTSARRSQRLEGGPGPAQGCALSLQVESRDEKLLLPKDTGTGAPQSLLRKDQISKVGGLGGP